LEAEAEAEAEAWGFRYRLPFSRTVAERTRDRGLGPPSVLLWFSLSPSSCLPYCELALVHPLFPSSPYRSMEAEGAGVSQTRSTSERNQARSAVDLVEGVLAGSSRERSLVLLVLAPAERALVVDFP
jgi:hypothetical protein